MGFVGGVIGSEIGKVGGAHLGNVIGKKIAGKKGGEIGNNIGSRLGQAGGAFAGSALIPFQTGGVVGKGLKRGAPTPILAHAGEVVLPLNTHATKAQMKTIEKNIRMKTKQPTHRFK